MVFRDREKDRLVPLRPQLFSAAACVPGKYAGKTRNFCLADALSSENLWAGIRDEAICYFAARAIPWHDGLPSSTGEAYAQPSNHLCCSQSNAVNALFPFRHQPDRLAQALRAAGLPVREVLRFDLDDAAASSAGFVAFEWIGARNYLRELAYGKVAADEARKRGAGFTSADFAIRYRADDGAVAILLGEWKYTERYPPAASLLTSASGTSRLAIYAPALKAPWTQISRLGKARHEDLFFDPFDQLMRLQLLSSEIEHAGAVGQPEMGVTRASVVHAAPSVNGELMKKVTSPGLEGRGSDIHAIWSSLVEPGAFLGVDSVAFMRALIAHAPNPDWARWMSVRYLPMK